MKRVLTITTFLALFGLALAGPPVDYQLMCGTGEEATLVGVASLVEDQLKVKLTDGALEACTEDVYGVADGTTVFTVSFFEVADGVVTDLQVVFEEDAEYVPAIEFEEVPEVAVLGKLGAQENRAAARERAAEAQARSDERGGGPPFDVPRGGGDDEDDEEDEEEEEEEEEEEVLGDEPEDEPTTAARGRR